MNAFEIATACAYEIAGKDHEWVIGAAPPVFFDGVKAPPDQACIAVWLPWNWAELSHGAINYGYVWPCARLLLEKMTADNVVPTRSPPLFMPEGVQDAAAAGVDDVSVRAIVMEHPVPTKEMQLDMGARTRPWFNATWDQMENRAVLPLLRLDVRVKPKEPTP